MVKDDLKDISDKLNDFERVFDNKLAFIESSLTRLLEKEEKEKNEEKKNKINENNNNNNNFNIINIVEDKKDNKDNKKDKKENKKEKVNKNWKEFETLLDKIFSEENVKYQEIKNEDIEKLKKLALNSLKKDKSIISKFTEYFKNIFNKREKDEYSINLVAKKNKIIEILADTENSLNKKKEKGGGFLSFFGNKENNKGKKEDVKVDVNNFDINAFRKEYQLSEIDFPDELLKKKYIEYKGNLQVLFCKLFD